MSTINGIFWSDIISSELEPKIRQTNDKESEPVMALYLANQEINFCEKLHSYFHFEQAFFHLILAKNLLLLEECREAIIQDPFNPLAKQMEKLLMNGQSLDELEAPTRPFNTYGEFLLSLDLDCDFSHYKKDSYWYYYDLYLADVKIENLYLAKKSIIATHQKYHQKAALAYYNRSLTFAQLGEEMLAKNDLIKAKNLNPDFINMLKKFNIH
jgi:hypothetical protein